MQYHPNKLCKAPEHHAAALRKVIWEIIVGDGRLSGLCQTASGGAGARNTLFVIMNVGWGEEDLTDGAANRKEHSEVTSLDHVWKIKADFYRSGLFKNRWLCVFCDFFFYTRMTCSSVAIVGYSALK